MLIDDIEQLKDWLTTSLSPICEADPGALAKYVVALVKKDKALPELKDSCVDQLEVFLQNKTKDFVETLFEVLENKSYIVKKKEEDVVAETSAVPLVTGVPAIENSDAVSTSSDQHLVTSTSKIDLKKEEELQKAFPIGEKRPRSKSLSPASRSREDDRNRRVDDRRNAVRVGYPPRRRSNSPRSRRFRSRSPYRRRSPFRPIRRSRSPGGRGYGRGRSRSRSYTSRSWSRSPRRSLTRSRSKDRIRSPGGRLRSRSPVGRLRSRSPGGRIRSRSPGGRLRSRSPGGRLRSRSPVGRLRSRSPGGQFRSRSPSGRLRSPRREVRARSPRGRSPYRRSLSPRYRSRSPRKRSRSIGTGSQRSRSLTPNKSRSGSPIRKVRRSSPDSRGPTPTQENGLVDSTIPTPTDSHSSISVLAHGSGRYGEGQSVARLRCRDYDEKGFCVRGEACVYDHGSDPVVVPQFPPGPPPGAGLPPGPLPPGHPMHLGLPPPGFFPNRMPVPSIHYRPDFQLEYNPEAPGLTRHNQPPYWPGGPPGGMPPFSRPPPPLNTDSHVPVKSRLGNRDLINLTVKREVKEEPEEDDTPSSSTRTVIAPKDDVPLTLTVTQPPPPGIPEANQGAPGPQGNFSQQQRFHPYQRFQGPRKPFDFNRIGGYRRPDQTNCTLEVRKIPVELNNIAKINEHFGKFGSLTNIQVKFEGDPEAALVSFSSNQEALACYKCSEPVFNNRFIKVFWHQKNKDNGGQDASSVSTTTQGVTQEDSSLSVKSRPAQIPHPSQLSLNNLTKKTEAAAAATSETSPTSSQPEQSVVYTSSMGNISKTVYNPAASAAAVAAAAAARAKAQAAQQAAFTSPTAVKAADFVSRMEKVKQIDAMKKEAALKKLEILKHKQELLEKQIEQQKKLIATLEKNKDMKEANKKAIMETLKTLSNSIDKLKTELRGHSITIPNEAGLSVPAVKSPEQAKKEILDVELELMTKTSSGEETLQLQKKLNELTKVANSLGLLGRGRGRGAVARGRAATTWVAKGVVPPTPPPSPFGRGRGRGAPFGKAGMAARTLDRRPKVVEVTGFDGEEKEEITSHLNGLKEVEKIEFNTDSPSAIVTFKTRKDAEMGILHGQKFKTKMLKMVWHVPKPDFSRSSSTTSVETEDHEEIDEEALLAGVEDEEEEAEEERSWRH